MPKTKHKSILYFGMEGVLILNTAPTSKNSIFPDVNSSTFTSSGQNSDITVTGTRFGWFQVFEFTAVPSEVVYNSSTKEQEMLIRHEQRSMYCWLYKIWDDWTVQNSWHELTSKFLRLLKSDSIRPLFLWYSIWEFLHSMLKYINSEKSGEQGQIGGSPGPHNFRGPERLLKLWVKKPTQKQEKKRAQKFQITPPKAPKILATSLH